jgi:enterochelin esterase-like enzyme
LSASMRSCRVPLFRLALVCLAALLAGGCGLQSVPPLLPTSIQSPTPTTCGCQLATLTLSSTGSPVKATPTLAASQGSSVSQTPLPPGGILATEDTTPHLPLQGQIISGSVETSLLNKPLGYLVYLPPGYDSLSDRRYPVLYLLHGQGSTDDQWVRLGINTAADRLIETGAIAPLIIVMPYELNSLPPDQTNFGQAVATELVPWIDAHYLTRTERVERAIGGLSRGASWAMRLGLVYWQTFGVIGAHSYPMFYGDGVQIPKWLAAIPPASYPRIYLDIGKGDEGIQLVRDFEAYLTDQGIPHVFHLYTGYHEENYWQSHLDDYLRWYTMGW